MSPRKSPRLLVATVVMMFAWNTAPAAANTPPVGQEDTPVDVSFKDAVVESSDDGMSGETLESTMDGVWVGGGTESTSLPFDEAADFALLKMNRER